jgi:hypothetical protein
MNITGKERDTESGNDYFGARHYLSSMGRFLSPDPLMASAKAWDPFVPLVRCLSGSVENPNWVLPKC